MSREFKPDPGKSGYRMPPEWAPHEATWLAFPHHRTDFPNKLGAVAHTFSEMARVLTQKERVRFLVRDKSERDRASGILQRNGVTMDRVDFILKDTNRSWLRDSMPLWVKKGRGRAGEKLAVNFRFDGWARYRDHQKDDAAGVFVAKKSSQYHVPGASLGTRHVLEGGSIDVDECGTLLTTEECLLTSPRARYAKQGREGAEAILRAALGVKKVLWLPTGIVGDDTSGHVDDFARFAPGGRVLICSETRKSDENYAPLRAARRALSGQMNARGTPLELVELPMPSPVFYDGDRLPASYANFYIANAAVLVPVFNDANDRVALDIISDCYPDRPVVGIYARDLVVGLGTLHCSSMQEPA